MMRTASGMVLFLAWLVWPHASATGSGAASVSGRVVDAATNAPLADAMLTVADKPYRSDAHGVFALDTAGADVVRIRVQGYERVNVPVGALHAPGAEVRLKSFRPKALYLSMYGIADKTLRGNALKLIDATELNALVIDVKGDRGLVPYHSAISLVADVGAQRVKRSPTLRN